MTRALNFQNNFVVARDSGTIARDSAKAFFEVFSSIELLQLRPEVLQILIQPTAKPNSKMFVTPRVGVLHAPGGFHTLEVLTVALTVAP